MRALALLIAFLPSIALANDLQWEAEAEMSTFVAYQLVTTGSLGIDLHSVEKETPAPKPRPVTYAEAHKLYKSERKPMVVMVTASWCPYCPKVKNELLDLQKDGKLDGASLVIVDYDQDRRTARNVMGTRRTLPAMAVYYYVDGKAETSRPVRTDQVEGILKKSNRNDPPKTTPVPVEKAAMVEPVRQAVYCRSCSR